MLDLFIRYIHFLSILTLVSSLAIEHIFLSKETHIQHFKKAVTSHFLLGCGIFLTLLSGLALSLIAGKPGTLYIANPIFPIKLTLFLFILSLYFYPTIFLLKQNILITDYIMVPKSIIMTLRFQLVICLIIPLLAIFISQGVSL